MNELANNSLKNIRLHLEMFRRVVLFIAVVLSSFQASSVMGAQSSCTTDASYPAPNEKAQVFYLQRTGNANTVVYTARLNPDGSINEYDPAHVYWRRFAEDGRIKKLGFLERNLAFGVEMRKWKTNTGKYIANLVSYPKLKVLVEPTGDGGAHALLRISGKLVRLTCIYVEWRKSMGIIPNVLHFDVVGHTVDGNERMVERILP